MLLQHLIKPNFLLCALLAMAASQVLAQADQAQVFSMEEAFAYAETHASAVRIAQADLAEAEGQIKETTAIGIPKINGSVGYSHFPQIPQQLFPDFITPSVYGVLVGEGVNDGSGQPIQAPPPSDVFTPVRFGLKNSLTAGVEASALLFDATFFIALKGARLYKSLAVKTLDQTKYQTHNQVAKAYLASLIAQRNLSTLERNVANLDETLAETRALYEEGFAEKLSVDRLELTRNNLAAQRESINQLVQVSLNLLKFQMGYPIKEPIELSTTLEEALGTARVEDLVGLEEFSPSSRPEYATLQVADSLNEIDLKRIQSGYYPSLVAFGSHQQQLQRDDLFDSNENPWIPTTVVGVTLNVPIFDGFTKKAQKERAMARSLKTREQIREFEQGARLALANAESSVRNARLNVELRENSVALAEEIYRVAQIKFREGVGSSLEVNSTQADLYSAQDALTNAIYDLAVAYVDYQDALGQL